MAAQFPNGTVFSISTALATAITLSAITNADPAVATTTTAPADGELGILTSGWPGLNNRIVRVANSAATTFELEGFDTSNTATYQAGQGIGTFQEVTTMIALSQVTNSQKSGGDQQFHQWQYLEDRSNTQQQRPTFKNAKSLTLTLDYDPALAWYDALDQADAATVPLVLQAVLPTGAKLYYYVYPSFDADPTLNINQNMQNTATFSLISRLTRYES